MYPPSCCPPWLGVSCCLPLTLLALCAHAHTFLHPTVLAIAIARSRNCYTFSRCNSQSKIIARLYSHFIPVGAFNLLVLLIQGAKFGCYGNRYHISHWVLHTGNHCKFSYLSETHSLDLINRGMDNGHPAG